MVSFLSARMADLSGFPFTPDIFVGAETIVNF